MLVVTILRDAPCVRDVSALFGHGNKANRFHSTHGLPHVETWCQNELRSFRINFLISSRKKPAGPASKSCSLRLIAFLKQSAH